MAFTSASATHFQHQDYLGTERLRTTYNGAVEGTYTSFPFGDAYAASGSDLDPYHYAQLDYDTETNTGHAQFRQYSSTQGRWMRPDPYYGSYDLTSPQTVNRYSYALNNPLGYTDPSGLDIICFDIGEQDSSQYSDGHIVNVDGWWPWLCGSAGEEGDGGGGGAGGGGGGGSGGPGSDPSNPKCSTAIMQPQYSAIFGQMSTQLKNVNPLFLMSTALQESGWNLSHVYGTNSSSSGKPLNNLFGMTNAGWNNIAYSSVQVSAQAWIADWGSYLVGTPQNPVPPPRTIQAYAAALNSNPKHMYNSNPAYPTELAKRYHQLVKATSACGTTF